TRSIVEAEKLASKPPGPGVGVSGCDRFTGRARATVGAGASNSRRPEPSPVNLAVLTAALAGAAGPAARGLAPPRPPPPLPPPAPPRRALPDRAAAKPVAVASSAPGRPRARRYAPRLAEMAREYGPRGVGFVGIDANRGDSAEEVARWVAAHPLPFPVLLDPG